MIPFSTKGGLHGTCSSLDDVKLLILAHHHTVSTWLLKKNMLIKDEPEF